MTSSRGALWLSCRENLMRVTGPRKSDHAGLTDEQASRQIVESIVELRSENQKRNIPRFPTPAALSGKLGNHADEGGLVLEEAGPPGDGAHKYEKRGNHGDADNRVLGFRIVDFSEKGVLLQFNCDDPLRLKESHLYLQLLGQRIPVSLRWIQQTGPITRGGFDFNADIDSSQYLARIISILNTELVDFAVNTYEECPRMFNEQFGIFIYLSIYYGLRLRLMETIATVNSSQILDTTDSLSITDKRSARGGLCYPYSSTYNVEQVIKNRSDAQATNQLYKYIKPFHKFGCSTIGMSTNIIFLKEDVFTTILNSVFIAAEDCKCSSTILPSLSFLYHSFLHLKQLLPGLFEEEEFHNQFRYYSSVILQIARLREKL